MAYGLKSCISCLWKKNKLGFIHRFCCKEIFYACMLSLWTVIVQLCLHELWTRFFEFWLVFSFISLFFFPIQSNLQEIFNKINGSRIFSVASGEFQQGTNTISTYLSWIRMMWEEFVDITCLLYHGCDIFKQHIEHAKNLKLFQFLNGWANNIMWFGQVWWWENPFLQ